MAARAQVSCSYSASSMVLSRSLMHACAAYPLLLVCLQRGSASVLRQQKGSSHVRR